MTSGNDYYFDRNGINDGEIHDTIATSDGQEWQFFTDGRLAESVGTKSGKNNGDWFGDIAHPEHLSLGQHSAGTGAPKGNAHQGAFAEILIYDRPLAEADREEETILTAKFDLDEVANQRAFWGIFRDRRPELYGPIATLDGGA